MPPAPGSTGARPKGPCTIAPLPAIEFPLLSIVFPLRPTAVIILSEVWSDHIFIRTEMRRLLLNLIFVFPFFSPAQAPSWAWAKSAAAFSGVGEGISVCTDVAGDVFIVGMFTSPILTFGSYNLTNANAGTEDIFIAKFDAAGNVIWAIRAGGTNDDFVYSINSDAGGNIFITGGFQSSAIPFGNITLVNTGGWDTFIVKYDPNGNVLWAKGATASGNDVGTSVSSDPNGNAIITGWFQGAITFGPFTLANNGSGNLFVVKYDANGNTLWAKRAGGAGTEIGRASC